MQSAETEIVFKSSSERLFLRACPICGSRKLHYAFSKLDYRLVHCDECEILLINPQPSDAELKLIYDENYFVEQQNIEERNRFSRMKRATARHYLEEIGQYCGKKRGRLLEIGCGTGDFLFEARDHGYEVVGVEYSASAAESAQALLENKGKVLIGEFSDHARSLGFFDVCVLSDVIEHVRSPVSFLKEIYRVLLPDGVLFIATPSLDSWSARLLNQNWMEFKAEHLYYFSTVTLQHAFFQSSFHEVIIRPGRKTLNLGYVVKHFERHPVRFISPMLRAIYNLAPRWLREKNVPIVASGLIAIARPKPRTKQQRLSVVIPAYNEAATIETLLQRLIQKEVYHLEIELIIVESNSTDGTRDIALRYQNHPRVQLILEEQPRGKGHAVRTGLVHATGDFVLIQDADLEYDLEDYEALLAPLIEGREAFVLGARHGGNHWWKMRKFGNQFLLSLTFNLGHLFFTTLINVLFGQRLKDPFTMYKVFRRDCLYGLNFECNRFDFDYELLIKLIRKGYTPVEIPVNYKSRSFKEGKKVSMLRDPIMWLWALLKLRFTRINTYRYPT